MLIRMICPELVQVLKYVTLDRDLMAKVIEKTLVAPKRLSLLLLPQNSYLETPKATSPRQGDIADIGRAVGGNHLINHESPILQVSPTGLFHLPEFLKCLHHIHCKKRSS